MSLKVPVVLVHGVGLDHTMWDAVAARMPGAITYDLLGHGVHRDQRPSMPGFVAQLAEVAPNGACDIVGFSLGALIAQEFALAFPARVRWLVLLNGVFQRTADERAAVVARVAAVRAGGYAANVEEAVRRWLPNGGAPAEAVRRVMAGNDPDIYADAYEVFATADAGLADRVSAIAAVRGCEPHGHGRTVAGHRGRHADDHFQHRECRPRRSQRSRAGNTTAGERGLRFLLARRALQRWRPGANRPAGCREWREHVRDSRRAPLTSRQRAGVGAGLRGAGRSRAFQ